VQFNAKCDPEKALQLREMYDGIVPGYHMNKKHWNTVLLDGTLPPQLVRELIDHSYELVRPRPKKNA
jgi:predicted DNA-binding protein (MmcQ/YjbR family)